MDKWEEFLKPEVLRSRLVAASIYTAAFEVLKDSIVGQIQDFYGVNDLYGEISLNYKSDYKEYESEVLSKNEKKNPVYASLEWLKESGVITHEDADAFERIKALRNDLAHRLTKILVDGLPDDFPKRFYEMTSLLEKIDKWWIVNAHIATDPNLSREQREHADEESVFSIRARLFHVMFDIALGPEERAKEHLEQYIKLSRRFERPN